MRVDMVVTNLDGTLLDSRHRLSATDKHTLEELGRLGVTRVVATGRSLFAARKVLGSETPIDFLAHTSGAGIVSWPGQAHLEVHHMALAAASALVEKLVQLELDFMLHRGIPDNHRFLMHKCSSDNADFDRRVELYFEHASALRLPLSASEGMCHAVIIAPADAGGRHEELQRALPDFRV